MDKNSERKKFQKSVNKQVSWMEKWHKKGVTWEKAVMVGSIGWMIVFPLVAGGYLGNYLDNNYKVEDISWTITFIILGLFIAFYSVWRVFLYER